MRYARPGSGVAHRLRDILAGNTQWYNAWLTLTAGSFGSLRITDMYIYIYIYILASEAIVSGNENSTVGV